MKVYELQDAKKFIIGQVREKLPETTNKATGELVLHTGLYRWASDGLLHDEPDPEYRNPAIDYLDL